MKSIHFYISNNNHHWQMMKPVMRALQQRGVRVTLISLCEFRRMDTPKQELDEMQIPYFIVGGMKTRVTSTSTGKKYIGSNTSLARNTLRWILWILRLRPALTAAYQERPDWVVVPNDVAFPFNRICQWLCRQGIPFVLFQEGVRFPLPNEVSNREYGSSGAEEIFAWGQASADYFRSLHLQKTQIREIGNPRFDQVLKNSYESAVQQLRARFGNDRNAILYVSNPVDDQGFCTHQTKLELFQMFLRRVEELVVSHHTRILVRLHPREDINDFTAIAKSQAFAEYITFVQDAPLFAILQAVSGTVVLASTVGLESMLFNTPVAVVKLPGHGFVHDYVSSGCAVGIDLDSPDSTKALRDAFWTEQTYWTMKCQTYIALHISNLGASAQVAADHMNNLLNR